MRLTALLFAFFIAFLTAVAPIRAAHVATPSSGQSDLSDVAPLPLTGERRAAFEAYGAEAMVRFGVPGASIAVVQGGEVVYLNGFGVEEYGSTRPVTPDTMFMIGSISKSMTTMLAASLVDDGHISWETPVLDLLPAFAVDDPESLHPGRHRRLLPRR
jgi:CubicO group peptidase (beta-lactamase class C family)